MIRYALALALAISAPALAQDADALRRDNAALRQELQRLREEALRLERRLGQERARQQAELLALRNRLNAAQDDALESARRLDLERRRAQDRLEEAQRQVQRERRERRLAEARLENRLRGAERLLDRARALLEQHGIEVPADPEPSPLAIQLQLSFPPQTTLTDAAHYLADVTGLKLELEGEVGARTLADGLAPKAAVTLEEALNLLVRGVGQPELRWAFDAEAKTVRIGSAPATERD